VRPRTPHAGQHFAANRLDSRTTAGTEPPPAAVGAPPVNPSALRRLQVARQPHPGRLRRGAEARVSGATRFGAAELDTVTHRRARYVRPCASSVVVSVVSPISVVSDVPDVPVVPVVRVVCGVAILAAVVITLARRASRPTAGRSSRIRAARPRPARGPRTGCWARVIKRRLPAGSRGDARRFRSNVTTPPRVAPPSSIAHGRSPLNRQSRNRRSAGCARIPRRPSARAPVVRARRGRDRRSRPRG